MTIRGKCACGNVVFEAQNEPVAQFYCHCRSCQTAHGAPVSAIAMFPEDNVTYSGDFKTVTVTSREDAARRVICPRCGTKVINEPGGGIRAILAVLCEQRDWFKPTMHIQWQDHVLDVRDDLPKFVDYPKEFGGSGALA